MKKYVPIFILIMSLITFTQCDKTPGIPIENLKTQLADNAQHATTTILKNEITGIHVEHIVLTSQKELEDTFNEDYKTIFLFINGKGNVVAADSTYEIVPKTCLLVLLKMTR